MTEERITIRQSGLNRYHLCGEAYRAEEEERARGVVRPSGTAAIRGTAFHSAAETNHRQKVTSGVDLPTGDLVEIADETFDLVRRRDGYYLTPEEVSVGSGPSLERAKRDARNAAAVYSEEVAHKIHPVDVEKKIEAPIAGTPIVLQGRLDTLTTAHRVTDLKSSLRAKTQRDADLSIQFTMYDLLVERQTGRRPEGHDLISINLKGGAKTIPTVRTDADRAALIARINNLLAAKKAGVFAPADPNSWICSPRWCSYYLDGCPYVNPERTARIGGR